MRTVHSGWLQGGVGCYSLLCEPLLNYDCCVKGVIILNNNMTGSRSMTGNLSMRVTVFREGRFTLRGTVIILWHGRP